MIVFNTECAFFDDSPGYVYAAVVHIIIDSMHFCVCARFHLGRTLSERMKNAAHRTSCGSLLIYSPKINCLRNLWADMKALVCAHSLTAHTAHDIQHIRNFVFIYDSCMDHCVCVVCYAPMAMPGITF